MVPPMHLDARALTHCGANSEQHQREMKVNSGVYKAGSLHMPLHVQDMFTSEGTGTRRVPSPLLVRKGHLPLLF